MTFIRKGRYWAVFQRAVKVVKKITWDTTTLIERRYQAYKTQNLSIQKTRETELVVDKFPGRGGHEIYFKVIITFILLNSKVEVPPCRL